MSRLARMPLLIMLTALAAVVTVGAADPAASAGRSAASVLPVNLRKLTFSRMN